MTPIAACRTSISIGIRTQHFGDSSESPTRGETTQRSCKEAANLGEGTSLQGRSARKCKNTIAVNITALQRSPDAKSVSIKCGTLPPNSTEVKKTARAGRALPFVGQRAVFARLGVFIEYATPK